MTDGQLSGHQPDGPAGPWRAIGSPEASPRCPCGVPVEQPWRTRDRAYSPASFIGGLFWYAVLAVALIAGFSPFSWILASVLGGVLLGSLVLQAIRRHRGFCWLVRSLWFGVATPGLPVRVVSAFSA
ncbi:hypothetical protein HDA39_007796 [Kribbella italica]|uniref:Uncharacterized protein n=1 Tax=Kribbella italica TaxID=1540520 RepID=A0A7W9JFW4_9ACTN|nr:hypothetical protein [Kribbella italica]